MGARQKLNDNAIGVCLVTGAVAGLLCQSWIVFIVVSLILMGRAVKSRDIRLKSDRPRIPRRRPRNPPQDRRRFRRR